MDGLADALVGAASAERPSMVVTFLPSTLEIAVTQERVASPLMCTVHAPQSAMPQPNFVPVMFSVSRRTQSSGMSGLTSTDCALPFKVKLMALESSLMQMDILQQLPARMKIRRNPFRRSRLKLFRREWRVTLEGRSTASTESDALRHDA